MFKQINQYVKHNPVFLWEKKKNDPEFWYKKGYEATELKMDANMKKEVDKENHLAKELCWSPLIGISTK